MKTLQEKICVMQAAAAGKEIEFCDMQYDPLRWQSSLSKKASLTWDWHRFDYRVKPEPKKLFLIKYDDGRVWGYYTDKKNVDAVMAGLRDEFYVEEYIQVLPKE